MTLNLSVTDDQFGRYMRRVTAIAERLGKSLSFEKVMDELQLIHDGKLIITDSKVRGTVPVSGKKKVVKLVGDHIPDEYYRTCSDLYVSEEFRSLVVAKARPTAAIPGFRHVELMRDMHDAQIEEMLGGGHIFTETEVCVLIADFISKQKGGKRGKLLNNGYANLFYLNSHVVNVSWGAIERWWHVDLCLRNFRWWNGGGQAFSPGPKS